MRAKSVVPWCAVALACACAPTRGRQLCEAIARRDVAAAQAVLAGPEISATRDHGPCVPADVFITAKGDQALTAIAIELVKAGFPADGSWIPRGQSQPVSAIEVAARNGNVELVRALIAVGLDLTSLESARALVDAAGAGHLAVVTALVEAGIDIEVTSGGETALDRARAGDRGHVVAFLEPLVAARAAAAKE